MKIQLVTTVVTMLLACQAVNGQDYPIKPTEQHKVLKASVGVWDAKIKMWAEGPDAAPTTSQGTETIRMLGELWTVSDFEYEFLGEKVFGHGTIGYDPALKKYVGTWHESGSPYRADMKGDYNEKTRTMTWNMTSREANGEESSYRIVITQKDETTRNFQMQMPLPGSDQLVKILEIDFAKRQRRAR